MSTVSNSVEQCQQYQQCQQFSTVIARCYLHLRWYFYLSKSSLDNFIRWIMEGQFHLFLHRKTPISFRIYFPIELKRIEGPRGNSRIWHHRPFVYCDCGTLVEILEIVLQHNCQKLNVYCILVRCECSLNVLLMLSLCFIRIFP